MVNLRKPQHCKISHWYYSSRNNLFHLKRWGVRRNDQFITENSLNYIQHGDAIVIDRGFNTAETLGTFGAKLEIPSFTKGQSQL